MRFDTGVHVSPEATDEATVRDYSGVMVAELGKVAFNTARIGALALSDKFEGLAIMLRSAAEDARASEERKQDAARIKAANAHISPDFFDTRGRAAAQAVLDHVNAMRAAIDLDPDATLRGGVDDTPDEMRPDDEADSYFIESACGGER